MWCMLEMLGHQAIISRRFVVRKLFDGTYRIINGNHGISGIKIISNIGQNIRLVICIIHWIEQLLIMIMPHIGNILGPSFIFYSVTVSHVAGVVFNVNLAVKMSPLRSLSYFVPHCATLCFVKKWNGTLVQHSMLYHITLFFILLFLNSIDIIFLSWTSMHEMACAEYSTYLPTSHMSSSDIGSYPRKGTVEVWTKIHVLFKKSCWNSAALLWQMHECVYFVFYHSRLNLNIVMVTYTWLNNKFCCWWILTWVWFTYSD